jgi:hypothetical protein
MKQFYFKDFKGKTHLAPTRDEAEALRKEVGGGYVIIQREASESPTGSPFAQKTGGFFFGPEREPGIWRSQTTNPLEYGVEANDLEKLKIMIEDINKLPRDHLSIRAGRSIEAILGLSFVEDDLEAGATPRISSCGKYASSLLAIPHFVITQALDLYCNPDGTIAHYRHNAASPSTFTGHGAFLRLNLGKYHIEHISEDRVTYGKRTKEVQFSSAKEVLSYVNYLASKNWYSSFLDPHARSIGLTDIPYKEDDSFRSWRDRAAEGDIKHD